MTVGQVVEGPLASLPFADSKESTALVFVLGRVGEQAYEVESGAEVAVGHGAEENEFEAEGRIVIENGTYVETGIDAETEPVVVVALGVVSLVKSVEAVVTTVAIEHRAQKDRHTVGFELGVVEVGEMHVSRAIVEAGASIAPGGLQAPEWADATVVMYIEVG